MNREGNIGEMADVGAVIKENLADAESSIRDMDMAKNMMESIKRTIFFRFSEAMFAQASRLPQDILHD